MNLNICQENFKNILKIFGTFDGIRTHTAMILSHTPPPVGLQECCAGWNFLYPIKKF